jgi:hypothetical protein
MAEPDFPQSIETAPKCGRQVLLFCGHWVCGHYTDDKLDPERQDDGWITDIHWSGMTWPPTHWVELPPPPSRIGKP